MPSSSGDPSSSAAASDPALPAADPPQKKKKKDGVFTLDNWSTLITHVYGTVNGTPPEHFSGKILDMLIDICKGGVFNGTSLPMNGKEVESPLRSHDQKALCLQRALEILNYVKENGFEFDDSTFGIVSYLCGMAAQCLDLEQLRYLYDPYKINKTPQEFNNFIKDVFVDEIQLMTLAKLVVGGGSIGTTKKVMMDLKKDMDENDKDMMDADSGETSKKALHTLLGEYLNVQMSITQVRKGDRADESTGFWKLGLPSNAIFMQNILQILNLPVEVSEKIAYCNSFMEKVKDILKRGRSSRINTWKETCLYVYPSIAPAAAAAAAAGSSNNALLTWFTRLGGKQEALNKPIIQTGDKQVVNTAVNAAVTEFFEVFRGIFRLEVNEDITNFIANLKREGPTAAGYTTAQNQAKRSLESTLISMIYFVINSSIRWENLREQLAQGQGLGKIRLLYDILDVKRDFIGYDDDEIKGIQRIESGLKKRTAYWGGQMFPFEFVEQGSDDTPQGLGLLGIRAGNKFTPVSFNFKQFLDKMSVQIVGIKGELGRQFLTSMDEFMDGWLYYYLGTNKAPALNFFKKDSGGGGGQQKGGNSVIRFDTNAFLLSYSQSTQADVTATPAPPAKDAKVRRRQLQASTATREAQKNSYAVLNSEIYSPDDENPNKLLVRSGLDPNTMIASPILNKFVENVCDKLIGELTRRAQVGSGMDLVAVLSRISYKIVEIGDYIPVFFWDKHIHPKITMMDAAERGEEEKKLHRQIIISCLSHKIKEKQFDIVRGLFTSNGAIKLRPITNCNLTLNANLTVEGYVGMREIFCLNDQYYSVAAMEDRLKAFLLNLIDTVGGHSDTCHGVNITEFINLLNSELMKEILKNDDNGSIKHILFALKILKFSEGEYTIDKDELCRFISKKINTADESNSKHIVMFLARFGEDMHDCRQNLEFYHSSHMVELMKILEKQEFFPENTIRTTLIQTLLTIGRDIPTIGTTNFTEVADKLRGDVSSATLNETDAEAVIQAVKASIVLKKNFDEDILSQPVGKPISPYFSDELVNAFSIKKMSEYLKPAEFSGLMLLLPSVGEEDSLDLHLEDLKIESTLDELVAKINELISGDYIKYSPKTDLLFRTISNKYMNFSREKAVLEVITTMSHQEKKKEFLDGLVLTMAELTEINEVLMQTRPEQRNVVMAAAVAEATLTREGTGRGEEPSNRSCECLPKECYIDNRRWLILICIVENLHNKMFGSKSECNGQLNPLEFLLACRILCDNEDQLKDLLAYFLNPRDGLKRLHVIVNGCDNPHYKGCWNLCKGEIFQDLIIPLVDDMIKFCNDPTGSTPYSSIQQELEQNDKYKTLASIINDQILNYYEMAVWFCNYLNTNKEIVRATSLHIIKEYLKNEKYVRTELSVALERAVEAAAAQPPPPPQPQQSLPPSLSTFEGLLAGLQSLTSTLTPEQRGQILGAFDKKGGKRKKKTLRDKKKNKKEKKKLTNKSDKYMKPKKTLKNKKKKTKSTKQDKEVKLIKTQKKKKRSKRSKK